MSNPTIREHNSETNKVIDREMTDAEFKIYQDDCAAVAASEAEATAKAADKAALLAKLGITADEAALLLA